MKKDELIEKILHHPAKHSHSKTALNQMNKGQLEEVLRVLDHTDLAPTAAEAAAATDGADLLGGDSAPSEEESGAVQEADGGAACDSGESDPVPGTPAACETPAETPVPQRVIGKHPVTGKPVYHVVE